MSMTFKEMQSFLENALKNEWKRPIMIKGLPGIGKTSIVNQLGEKYGLEVRTVIWSQLAPVDVRGVPDVRDGITHWNPPVFFPRDGKGILFLDEFNMSSPSMMQLGQQLIQERRVGEFTVPDTWFIWATGNCSKSKAAIYDMPGPTRNRYSIIDVEYNMDDFRPYAVRENIDESILGFLAFQESYLHKIPDNDDESQFPTPRSWFFCDELIKMGMRNINQLSTVIGEGVATEFDEYCKVLGQLPNKELIYAGTKFDYKWPDNNPSLQFAIITSLGLGAKTAKDYINAIGWLMGVGAKTEMIVMVMKYMRDVFNVNGSDSGPRSPEFQKLVKAMHSEKHLKALTDKFRDLLS